jgi:hypothetical protein
MVIIIEAVCRITFHLDFGFRCLKEILKKTSPVFLEALAAGVAGIFRSRTLHLNFSFTAALLRVVDTVAYGTIQSGHCTLPPFHTNTAGLLPGITAALQLFPVTVPQIHG